jgi:hypothetical protein
MSWGPAYGPRPHIRPIWEMLEDRVAGGGFPEAPGLLLHHAGTRTDPTLRGDRTPLPRHPAARRKPRTGTGPRVGQAVEHSVLEPLRVDLDERWNAETVDQLVERVSPTVSPSRHETSSTIVVQAGFRLVRWSAPSAVMSIPSPGSSLTPSASTFAAGNAPASLCHDSRSTFQRECRRARGADARLGRGISAHWSLRRTLRSTSVHRERARPNVEAEIPERP